jgi:hypothetical protein
MACIHAFEKEGVINRERVTRETEQKMREDGSAYVCRGTKKILLTLHRAEQICVCILFVAMIYSQSYPLTQYCIAIVLIQISVCSRWNATLTAREGQDIDERNVIISRSKGLATLKKQTFDWKVMEGNSNKTNACDRDSSLTSINSNGRVRFHPQL